MSLQHIPTVVIPQRHMTPMESSQIITESGTFATSQSLMAPSILVKTDALRFAVSKDKPVYPVKAKYDQSCRPVGSPRDRRRKELPDEKCVEEEVKRNVSKIMSASRISSQQSRVVTEGEARRGAAAGGGVTVSVSPNLPFLHCTHCRKAFANVRTLQKHEVSCRSTIPSRNSGSPQQQKSWQRSHSLEQVVDVPDQEFALSRSVNNNLSPLPAVGSGSSHHSSSDSYSWQSIPEWSQTSSEQHYVTVGEHLKAAARLRKESGEECVLPSAPPQIVLCLPPPPPPKTPVHNVPTVAPFKCTICYKTFSCRKNVRRHMQALHKEREQDKKSRPQPREPTNFQRRKNVEVEVMEKTKKSPESFVMESSEEVQLTKLEPADPFQPTHSTYLNNESNLEEMLNGSVEEGSGLEKGEDPLLAYFDWRCNSSRSSLLSPSSPTPDNTIKETLLRPSESSVSAKKILFPSRAVGVGDGGKRRLTRENDEAVLRARSVNFVVSRSAASRASPVLAALLAKQTEATLDVEPAHMQALLLVHAEPSTLSAENVAIVMEAAIRFNFSLVRVLCEKFIGTVLARSSLLRAIRLSHEFGLCSVKESLMDALTIDVFHSVSTNLEYCLMPAELKAELLEKWGSFL